MGSVVSRLSTRQQCHQHQHLPHTTAHHHLVMPQKYLVILIFFSLGLISGLPAPQSAEEQPLVTGETDEEQSNDAGDIIRAGASLASSLLALFGDQELRDQVGNTVSSGLNLTGELVRAGVPLAMAAIEQAPALINTTRTAIETLHSQENRERVSQIAGVGSRVAASAGSVASQAPLLFSQGTKLAGSIIHAANETAPLVVSNIQEFTDQIPLIAGFASAYAEVNAEQTGVVVRTFHTSLQCDLQCGELEDAQLKAECEVEFCKEVEEEEVK